VRHRRDVARRRRENEVEKTLGTVGLGPAGRVAGKFPHELSGGQRQRVGFAAALAGKPKLIVADEPVSMLDVSIRIGVLNLMSELREREGLSFLYITHDVASARYVADRVLVLYAGHLVEEGPAEDVLQRPKHPYTQLLLSAVPDPRAALESLLGHLDEIQAAGQACAERAPSVLRLVGHGSSDAAATYGVYAFGLVAGWTALRDS